MKTCCNVVLVTKADIFYCFVCTQYPAQDGSNPDSPQFLVKAVILVLHDFLEPTVRLAFGYAPV